MLNTQRPESVITSDGQTLQVHSIFSTIQGEGPFSGYPAIFIRLAGCNLQCPGCDTDYTSNKIECNIDNILESIYFEIAIREIFLIVITGGEPFRQNISPLCNVLIRNGFVVQIETNGTLRPQEKINKDVKLVISPKTGSINSNLLNYDHCYKYVLQSDNINTDDGLPIKALNHSAHPHIARPQLDSRTFNDLIFLQPMDEGDPIKNKRNLDAVIKSCMEHGYILQLQIHKLIGVE